MISQTFPKHENWTACSFLYNLSKLDSSGVFWEGGEGILNVLREQWNTNMARRIPFFTFFFNIDKFCSNSPGLKTTYLTYFNFFQICFMPPSLGLFDCYLIFILFISSPIKIIKLIPLWIHWITYNMYYFTNEKLDK